MSGPVVQLAESIAFAKAVSELLSKTRGHRKQGKMSAALDALIATVSALETRARIAESAIKAAEARGVSMERERISAAIAVLRDLMLVHAYQQGVQAAGDNGMYRDELDTLREVERVVRGDAELARKVAT